MKQPLFKTDRMDYETPRGGTTIGGYVARRLHKTILLKPIPALLADDSALALAWLGVYTAAASTSFGPARYQPSSDSIGDVIETRDPATNARVTVTVGANLRFGYRIEMDEVGVLTGEETITGTTIGLRGLGMPAPTTFEYLSDREDYVAEAKGLMTSELVPGFGTWRIRGHGSFNLSDHRGNRGQVSLDRSGHLVAAITARDGRSVELVESLV
jgi:hypothetical protein